MRPSKCPHGAASWMRTKGRVYVENLPATPPKRGEVSSGQKESRKGQTDHPSYSMSHIHCDENSTEKNFFLISFKTKLLKN